MYKYTAIFIITLILSFFSTHAQFTHQIVVEDSNYFRSVVRDLQGNLLVLSTYGQVNDIENEICVLKMKPQGNIIWERIYKVEGSELPRSICATSDGGFAFVADKLEDDTVIFKSVVVKADSAGNMQWHKIFRQTGSISAQNLMKIIADPNGGLVLAGMTIGYIDLSYYDFYFVKLSDSGDVEWSSVISDPHYQRIDAIIPTSDGGYAVTGEVDPTNSGSYNVMPIMKIDHSGNFEWYTTVGGAPNTITRGTAIAQLQNGNFIAVGYTSAFTFGNQFHGIATCVSSTGQIIWTKTISNSGFASGDEADAVISTVDGNFIVAGELIDPTFQNATIGSIIKMDANGDLLWARGYGGLGAEVFYSVIEDDKGFFASGITNSPGFSLDGNYTTYLVRTDTAGNDDCNSMEITPIISTVSATSIPSELTSGSGYVLTDLDISLSSALPELNIVCLATAVPNLEQADSDFNYYPNPFTNELNIQQQEYDSAKVFIYDAMGRLIFSKEGLDDHFTLNTSSWIRGVYFISFFEKGKIMRAKVIVKL